MPTLDLWRKEQNNTNPAQYDFKTEKANLLAQSTSFYDSTRHKEDYKNIIQRSEMDLPGSFMLPPRKALIHQCGHFITQTNDNEGNISPSEYKVIFVRSTEEFSCKRVCSFEISDDKMNYRITSVSNDENFQEPELIIKRLLENKSDSILMLEYQPYEEPTLESTLSLGTA